MSLSRLESFDDLFRKLERTKAQGRSGETWVKKVSMSRMSKGLVCVAEILALELSLTAPIGINEWLSIYHYSNINMSCMPDLEI